MEARRLRWRGASQHRSLLLELRRQLGDWLRAWSVDPELLSLQLGGPSAGLAADDLRWLCARGKTGTVWLGLPRSELSELGARLARVAPNDTLGLGPRLGERALRALLAQWLGGTSVEANALATESPSSDELESRFGGVQFRLKADDFGATVLIDSALCDHLAPVERKAMSALARRESALGHEAIVLDVTLPLGQASLADTHGLQVGDVLVSSTPLTSNFNLSHPDARALALGRLFRLGAQRALQLDTPTPKRQDHE